MSSFVDVLFFLYSVCYSTTMTLFASVYMCLVVTSLERAGLLALISGVEL